MVELRRKTIVSICFVSETKNMCAIYNNILQSPTQHLTNRTNGGILKIISNNMDCMRISQLPTKKMNLPEVSHSY